MGQGAAVYAEEGRQLLPGEGDAKGMGPPALRLHGEVDQHPVPEAPLGQDGQTVVLTQAVVG